MVFKRKEIQNIPNFSMEVQFHCGTIEESETTNEQLLSSARKPPWTQCSRYARMHMHMRVTKLFPYSVYFSYSQ